MGSKIRAEVAALRESVDSLRSSVSDMQTQQAQEVRTERVTVVDEDGVERVVLSARLRTGSVLVQLPSPPGQTTGAEFYALEDPGDGQHDIGVCLIRDGNIVNNWHETITTSPRSCS